LLSLNLHEIQPFISKRYPVGGGDDTSLARHTSRIHRTESITSLERGDCSCDELQVFSSYIERKEAFQVMCAISTTSRRELY